MGAARVEFDLALKELRAAEYCDSPPGRTRDARGRFGKAQAALEAEEAAAPAPAPTPAPAPVTPPCQPDAGAQERDDEILAGTDARSGKRKGK